MKTLLFICSIVVILVALLPLFSKSFRYYLVRECYSAQIEASAIVGLRFGYTGFGLAYWPNERLVAYKAPWYPSLHLTLWSPELCLGQVMAFQIWLGRRTFGYMTRGEVLKDSVGSHDVGFFTRRAKYPFSPLERLVALITRKPLMA